jgi:hypothetical protein
MAVGISAERLIGRPLPKKCDDRANYDSNANAVNYYHYNQSLGGTHRLRHFARPKIHFFLERMLSSAGKRDPRQPSQTRKISNWRACVMWLSSCSACRQPRGL